MSTDKINILFVCVGNICRSPAAQGIFQKLIDEKGLTSRFYVDSCATTAWHVGQGVNKNTYLSAKKRGLILTHTAQMFETAYFECFDYILAVNHDVMATLLSLTPNESYKKKVYLLGSFSKKYPNQEIPDPYYGGEAGFDHVMDMLEDCCHGVLETLV